MSHYGTPDNTWTSESEGAQQVSETYIRYVPAYIYDFTVNVATGDGQFPVIITPQMDGMNLVWCRAWSPTAGTGGTMTIQIRNVTKAQDMLATRITVDDGEQSSDTAATLYDIDEDADDVSDGDELQIDVDTVHSSPAKGLIVQLGFKIP